MLIDEDKCKIIITALLVLNVTIIIFVGALFHMIITVKITSAAGFARTISINDMRQIEQQMNLIEQAVHGNTSKTRYNDEQIDVYFRELREEQKRLQLQIDRLEGHLPLSYTSDIEIPTQKKDIDQE